MNKREYFDGAMGTLIAHFSKLPCEYMNIINPNKVLDIHKEYLKLGVSFIKTNSFNIVENNSFSIKELVNASIEIANRARADMDIKIAFSIGPAKNIETYKEIIKNCRNKKIDYYSVETMINLDEAKNIIDLIRFYDDKPIILSFVVKNKLLLDQYKLKSIFSKLNLKQVEILGVNCIDDYDDIKYALDVYKENCNLDLLVMPNSGKPEDNNLSYKFDDELFIKLKKENFKYLGGCCGIDENFLKKIILIDKN